MAALREQKKLIGERRFRRLTQRAFQLAQSEPEEALRLFEESKRVAPHLWTDAYQKWVTYAQQLLAYQNHKARAARKA